MTSPTVTAPAVRNVRCGHGCGFTNTDTRTVALHMRDDCPRGKSPDANGSGPPGNRR